MDWSTRVSWKMTTGLDRIWTVRMIASAVLLLFTVTGISPLSAQTARENIELPSVAQAALSFHDSDSRLEQIFRAGLLNTLKEAARQPDGTIYVGTGDIFAEWLRDSFAQVRPYSALR